MFPGCGGRPQRADARRNFDALLGAAREVFATDGGDASLEGIARRAGVSIATLYRNFPTRQHLFVWCSSTPWPMRVMVGSVVIGHLDA